MLKNFENQTFELTPKELLLSQNIADTISKNSICKDTAITSSQLIELFKDKSDVTLTGARIRKIINYICNNSLPNLIGTSKGYYITTDTKEIKMAIGTLQSRANENNKRADILINYLKK